MESIEKILIGAALVAFLGAMAGRFAAAAPVGPGGGVGAAKGAMLVAGARLAFAHAAAYIAPSGPM
jgi:hypothetical protein